MKKLLLLLMILLGCHKPQEDILITVMVKENGTRLLVPGAKFEIYENIWMNIDYYYTGLTDQEGKCRIPIELFNNSRLMTKVSKEKYCEFTGKETSSDVTLYPEGWIKLQIHKSEVYPGNCDLIIASSTRGKQSEYFYFNTPADSVISIRCFGNTQNTLEWRVADEFIGSIRRGE